MKAISFLAAIELIMYNKTGLHVGEHNIHPIGIKYLLVTEGFRFTLHIV